MNKKHVTRKKDQFGRKSSSFQSRSRMSCANRSSSIIGRRSRLRSISSLSDILLLIRTPQQLLFLVHIHRTRHTFGNQADNISRNQREECCLISMQHANEVAHSFAFSFNFDGEICCCARTNDSDVSIFSRRNGGPTTGLQCYPGSGCVRKTEMIHVISLYTPWFTLMLFLARLYASSLPERSL